MNPSTGMRDFGPSEVLYRRKLTSKVEEHFRRYGGVPIETPIVEQMKNVERVYGDEFNKQVYKVDGMDLLLRYDLTLSGSRYVAKKGPRNFRRYQIGKVYRKDKPHIGKGRYREFVQADFDIVGDYGKVGNEMCDIEIIQLLSDILQDLLGSDEYIIRVNDRCVLKEVMNGFGVEDHHFNQVCSILDKIGESDVSDARRELSKSCSEETIEKIVDLIRNTSRKSNECILEFLVDRCFVSDGHIKRLKDMIEMLNLKKNNIQLDLSMVRGLDYYTGIIYEANYKNKSVISSTIAAGGRYDELIGHLTKKKSVPSIGLSIGIERIYDLLRMTSGPSLCSEHTINPQVFVASVGKGLIKERLRMCWELRCNGLRAEMMHNSNPKMRQQLNKVFDRIPYMIIIGEDEIASETIKIKDVMNKTEFTFPRGEGVKWLVSNIL